MLIGKSKIFYSIFLRFSKNHRFSKIPFLFSTDKPNKEDKEFNLLYLICQLKLLLLLFIMSANRPNKEGQQYWYSNDNNN